MNLRPVLDYDIDYLQGRILLAEPLTSTEDDDQLVHSGGLSGQDAYLVVRYEYTPGFDEIDALNTGGQGHYWINDHIKLRPDRAAATTTATPTAACTEQT